MTKQSSKLVVASNDDIFSVINSWPYHLLDGVKAASIRSYSNEIRYVVMRLIAEKKVESFDLSMCVDNIRNILTWIDLYDNAKVELHKMGLVKKELQGVLAYIEKLYTDISMDEKNDPYHTDSEEDDEA